MYLFWHRVRNWLRPENKEHLMPDTPTLAGHPGACRVAKFCHHVDQNCPELYLDHQGVIIIADYGGKIVMPFETAHMLAGHLTELIELAETDPTTNHTVGMVNFDPSRPVGTLHAEDLRVVIADPDGHSVTFGIDVAVDMAPKLLGIDELVPA